MKSKRAPHAPKPPAMTAGARDARALAELAALPTARVLSPEAAAQFVLSFADGAHF